MEYTLITYTTRYRKGGEKFERVAKTLAKEKLEQGQHVICLPTESKRDLRATFDHVSREQDTIKEFHFIGHSGMYGPMFGSVEYPEQFSPHEVRELKIPFSENAEAYFHCCRSARWFAPYFARTQGVTTYGYHWYTAFSAKRSSYKVDFSRYKDKELYCFGCPGKKSHGYTASIKKYFGLIKAEELKRFEPDQGDINNSYNEVAQLYHKVFEDIKVRRDEFRWIVSHLPSSGSINVLDIGCGNGALLKELANRVSSGVGVDVSKNLIGEAIKHNESNKHINFKTIKGPQLPFTDGEFDVVISMMSFRYLDWDPIMSEIQRVLKVNGKLLIIDMVTAPVKFSEYPQFFSGKLRHYFERLKSPEFYKNLRLLVNNPAWATMLKYNPIRSEHEMKWYLESRFPGRKVNIINIGYNSRILAFDSVSMKNVKNLSLAYP